VAAAASRRAAVSRGAGRLQGIWSAAERTAQPLSHSSPRAGGPRDPRPSLAWTQMVEELLIALFVQHERRRLDRYSAAANSGPCAKAGHGNATARRRGAGVRGFLDRLDPGGELEARFGAVAARRGQGALRDPPKAQYWDLFTSFFAISSRWRRSILPATVCPEASRGIP